MRFLSFRHNMYPWYVRTLNYLPVASLMPVASVMPVVGVLTGSTPRAA